MLYPTELLEPFSLSGGFAYIVIFAILFN